MTDSLPGVVKVGLLGGLMESNNFAATAQKQKAVVLISLLGLVMAVVGIVGAAILFYTHSFWLGGIVTASTLIFWKRCQDWREQE